MLVSIVCLAMCLIHFTGVSGKDSYINILLTFPSGYLFLPTWKEVEVGLV